MLPLPAAITSQLDKASIIRLTISYLKLRDFSGHGDPPWTREASSSSKLKSEYQICLTYIRSYIYFTSNTFPIVYHIKFLAEQRNSRSRTLFAPPV